jgi:hypothetical protein
MRMNACAPPTLWGGLFLCLMASQLLIGCGSKEPAKIPANEQAQTDPNGRAQALLDEFNGLPEGDRADWVSMNTFALSVFENVTDPQLRSAYESQIKPLQTGR